MKADSTSFTDADEHKSFYETIIDSSLHYPFSNERQGFHSFSPEGYASKTGSSETSTHAINAT
jgi:hypothetical protein